MAQDNPDLTAVSSLAASFDAAQKKTESLRSTWYGASAPTSPLEGQLWWNGSVLKIRQGASWAPVTGQKQVQTVHGVDGTTDGVVLFVADVTGTVARIRILPNDSVAVDGSDYFSVQCRNVTDSVDLFATAPGTSEEEWTAGTPKDFTPDQNQSVTAGEILRVTVSGTGTPTALGALGIELTITHA